MMQPPTSTNKYMPEPLARAALHRFIYQFDPRTDGIPKRIDPSLVERFLREELSKKRPDLSPAKQMVALADYYDVRGIVPDLFHLLDHTEKTEKDLLVAVTLTNAVGILGNPAQRETGRSYFHYLLSLPFAERRMAALVESFDVYQPEESPALLLAVMERALASLKQQAETDPAAEVPLRNLEDLRTNEPPHVAGAAALRREIMSAELDRRLDQLVNIYLDVDMRYYEYLSRWSARMLLREARGGKPEAIIAAFRRALDRLSGAAPGSAEAARRSRALHAIQFLGGQLSPEELRETDPAQKFRDLLSTD